MRSLGLIAAAVLVAIGIYFIVQDGDPTKVDPTKVVRLKDIGEDIVALVVLAGVGAFGGYLSAIRPELLKSADPRESSKSFRRAVLQGAAGAIIIVTLAPVDPVTGLFTPQAEHQHPHVVIKLIALALIGGYAGGALLESYAQQFAKKLNDVEEQHKTLADEVEKEAKAINLLEEAYHKDAEAINLVEEALHGLDTDLQALKRAMQQSTSVTRSEIFNRADDNRPGCPGFC